ncbi:MAG: hypothetical protein LBV45_07180 [Xanthomonadaceae bacterium]|jgi:hypothetical protein|nr:hypothetical protein [Xanthomonadaceae bacterium]
MNTSKNFTLLPALIAPRLAQAFVRMALLLLVAALYGCASISDGPADTACGMSPAERKQIILAHFPDTYRDPLFLDRYGIFILSSHPGCKGLLYSGEPYKLYKNGQLIQQGLTDDRAIVVYELDKGAHYRFETSIGHVFDVTPTAR